MLDSESIEKKIPKLSRRALSLLKYQNVNPLVFLRTEHSSKISLLQEIPEIHLIETNGRKCIKTPTRICDLGDFADQHVRQLGEYILKKPELTKEEIEAIELIFVQEALNRFNSDNLLVSENTFLLSHAADFQRKFSTPLNIVTMEEAAEFVDLLFKYNSVFYLSRFLTTSKHNWYWLSFRNKIPYYRVDTRRFQNQQNQTLGDLFKSSILDAFSQRFIFFVDEY